MDFSTLGSVFILNTSILTLVILKGSCLLEMKNIRSTIKELSPMRKIQRFLQAAGSVGD